MTRTTILASLLVFGIAGTAGAQSMPEANVTAYPPPGIGNVVGGGAARLLGGGDNSIVQYEPGGPMQAGRAARLAGVGGETEIIYLEPLPPGAHGRDAMLLGGSDNATIVYLDSAQRLRG
jgi:hypothetical protein